MTTLSPEHYAFLDKLFPDDNLTSGVTRKVPGKYNIRQAHPEIEAHTRYIVTLNEQVIAEELSIEDAKAAARKHQLETIAKEADLSVIPMWRDIESAFKAGLEAACGVIDSYSKYDQSYCCNGQMCGCYGVSVHEHMKCHILEALPTPPETEQ